MARPFPPPLPPLSPLSPLSPPPPPPSLLGRRAQGMAVTEEGSPAPSSSFRQRAQGMAAAGEGSPAPSSSSRQRVAASLSQALGGRRRSMMEELTLLKGQRPPKPELLATLIELAARRIRQSGNKDKHSQSPSAVPRSSAPGSNTSRFRSELPSRPQKLSTHSVGMLAEIERMIQETRGLVEDLGSLQTSLKLWSGSLAVRIHRLVVKGMSRRLKMTPSAAEATLMVDEFVKDEEDRASNRSANERDLITEATLMVDDFVQEEEDRDSDHQARDLVAEATLTFDDFVKDEEADGDKDLPPSPTTLPIGGQVSNEDSSRVVSRSQQLQSRSGLISRGQGPAGSSRSALRSRGWSRLVDTIALSPGGVQLQDGPDSDQGGVLEMPRTPEDFGKLLKDAGFNEH